MIMFIIIWQNNNEMFYDFFFESLKGVSNHNKICLETSFNIRKFI